MKGHPHLHTLLILFNEENQPFRKVHRMIDLFESIIKTYTVVIISEYVKRNKLSDTAKELLAHGLRTPSLGTWQLFSRVLIEELNNEKHHWMLTDFIAAFESLDKALEKEKTNAISLRNSYAHGATPSDEKCNLDIKKFEPFLNQLLLTKWLENTRIEEIDGMVFLESENNSLCLHPILLYRREESPASFAFFNDLKDDKVGLLNYPLAKHYREKKFYSEFHEYLPLQNWKTKGNNEFYQRIEELTDTFKGRNVEREKLLHFVIQKNKGYFSVQGNPGVGKSALLAQFLKDLRTNEEAKKINVVSYFIRRGTPQAQVNHFLNYLIKCTDDIFPTCREINALDKTYWSLQNQLFEKWRLWGDHNKDNKLLFLIDGLDEGIDDNMVQFMPRENFENILFIYGSRAGGHNSINEFWGTLPTENHSKLELNGLNREDIRAMIYEVANKYEVERESSWIKAVQERSQGNPLYMKLLCDAIENGHIALNDFNALPKEIDDYYKAILQRYAKDNDGDAIFASLYTFAASKDYLTIPQLGLINKLSDATLERVGSTLKEVLNENPLTKDVLDYQLFHESFREYLVKQNGVKVMEAADRLINFCADWQTLEGTYEQRYAFEYYAVHLSESKKEVHHSELLALLKNEPYQVEQKRVLKQFDATKQLYQLSLIKAGELNKHDIQLEAALGLLDLKYEVANDAPQIVLLIANGEIDLGLKRIESFAGPDKEGIKRKFILYMLCLLELTLLDSKEKSYRKTSIEKLLNHLNEHLPVDHSLINWNDFFPSYLVFLMATEWATLGLDYLIVYKRASDWEKKWIKEKGPYSDIQFEVLSACVDIIGDMKREIEAKIFISTEMAKQGNFLESMSFIAGINEKKGYLKAVMSISMELIKQGNLTEAMVYSQKFIGKYYKCIILIEISKKLRIQGKPNEALDLLHDAKIGVSVISETHLKCKALAYISSEFNSLGKLDEAKLCLLEAEEYASKIADIYLKSIVFAKISREYSNLNSKKDANELLQESLFYSGQIGSFSKKNKAMLFILGEFEKQGNNNVSNLLIEDLKKFALNSRDKILQYFALTEIIELLASKGRVEEALGIARFIDKEDFLFKCMSKTYVKQGNILQALSYMSKINQTKTKIDTGLLIFKELLKLELAADALKVLEKTTKYALNINFTENKFKIIKPILNEIIQLGNINQTFELINEILLDLKCEIAINEKSNKINIITNELKKHKMLFESLTCAQFINDKIVKCKTMLKISSEFGNLGLKNEATTILIELKNLILQISNEEMKCEYMLKISGEFERLGNSVESSFLFEEFFELVKKILSIESKKEPFMVSICKTMVENGKINEFIFLAKNFRLGDFILNYFCTTLVRHGKLIEAMQSEYLITNKYHKSMLILGISKGYIEKRNIILADLLLKKAIEYTYKIKDEYYKTKLLQAISLELAKQDKLSEAIMLISEALVCARRIKNDKLSRQKTTKESLMNYVFGNSVDSVKIMSMIDISIDLLSLGEVTLAQHLLEEIFLILNEIENIKEKDGIISYISVSLAKKELFTKALDFSSKIIDKEEKIETMILIGQIFSNLGKLFDAEKVFVLAFDYTMGINKLPTRNSLLMNLSTKFVRMHNWQLAEKVSLEISEIAKRHSCWQDIAVEISKQEGWQNALLHVNKLQKEEARFFYLKGLVKNLTIIESNSECLELVLPYLTNDTESIEKLMQNYALRELFFGDSDQNKIQRLDQSLNIKWAVDIKKAFPSVTLSSRVYANIKEWLHDIYDEDIKDQIELWARQVSKGKISDDQFNANVESLLSN